MNIQAYFQHVDEAAKFLSSKTTIQPKAMLVLSGGMDGFVEAMTDKVTISAGDIPHFPTTRVEGHTGKLTFGNYAGVPLVALQGRYHYYEGHSPQDVVFPYFVMNKLGAMVSITTNAVGAITEKLNVGDISVVTDHINMMGTNPLIGLAMSRKTNQFTSMQDAYNKELRGIAHDVAQSESIELKESVYLGTPGPSYETPAEIRMFRQMGADTVGMSTVFETIACNFLGMKVLTFNCISNVSADRFQGVMSHDHVIKAMKDMQPKVIKLLQGIVDRI
ncbi:MAG: purine-nucleoside phosphorylase [Deltaproteobacteria bacterium CG11_big_fil_rev_8_21_14_0_20_47_16]|nr:MAG: purine-nucleoside phosphorylase [Deltaproteobacteria bacterium CG11_big_fil_rev_8_21_14_0_20_47_16]